MYKGTYDGDLDEIKFVASFNSMKEKYNKYLSNFAYNSSNIWMVRVTGFQFSYLSEKKVYTRADSYLVYINSNIDELLEENAYLLSEDILKINNISYEKIPYSGVSIKMTNSKNFQIIKTGPDSFKKLYGSYELGAGASLFRQKEIELPKNLDLIKGWKTTVKNMTRFFSEFTHGNEDFYNNKHICEEISKYSCNKIKSLIENSTNLQQKIFNGIQVYDEPYTAHYFYHGNEIQNLTIIPFTVTTGSGRSKGDYTIVLKPSKK